MGRPENLSGDFHVGFLNCWDFRWSWKGMRLRMAADQYSRRCTTQPVRLWGECGNERVVFLDYTAGGPPIAFEYAPWGCGAVPHSSRLYDEWAAGPYHPFRLDLDRWRVAQVRGR